MRLKEFCEKTGVPKRTIHYYIQEKLLIPGEDPQNGYKDFSDEDVSRLMLIRSLRALGLSVSSIRAVLHSPSSSAYYLNKQIKQYRRDIRQMTELCDSLRYMQQNLPLNPELKDLSLLVKQANIPSFADDAGSPDIDEFDSHLVNRFLWESFLPDEPMNEYQEFLWDKVNRTVNNEFLKDYRLLSDYLSGLDEKDIVRLFRNERERFRELTELDEGSYTSYVDKMESELFLFLSNQEAIASWKTLYHSFYEPNTRIFDSPVKLIMAELSPFFKAYLKNVHVVCDMMYDRIQKDPEKKLLRKMEAVLNGYYDIESCSHGQLQAMISY